MHRSQRRDQRIRRPAFALDAADAGAAAPGINLLHGVLGAEDFVQIAHRAFIRIAGIDPPHPCRVGHHGLQLLPDLVFRLTQQNVIVVTLGHLAPIGARQLGRGREQRLGFGKYFASAIAVKLIEAPAYLAGKLDMGRLVFAHGDVICLVDQNVGRLQHRITEKSVGTKVLLLDVFTLLLIRGHSLQPAQRREHAEQQMQLGVLRNQRLQKQHALIRMQARGHQIDQYFDGILLDL